MGIITKKMDTKIEVRFWDGKDSGLVFFSEVEDAKNFFGVKRKEMGFDVEDITKSNNPNLMWKCGSFSFGQYVVLEADG